MPNHVRIEDRDVSEETKLFGNKLIKKNINKILFNFSDGEINSDVDLGNNDITKDIIFNYSDVDEKKHAKSPVFKTDFPIITNKKDLTVNKSRTNKNEIKNKFFCPYCEHCNNIKDQFLENHIQSLARANITINRGFEYIMQNLKFFDKNAIDLFSFHEKTMEDSSNKDKTVHDNNNNSADIIEVKFL